MTPDELKQTWQTQALPRRISLEAEVLLQQLRRNKTSLSSSIFWGELLLMLGLLAVAGVFVGFSVMGLRDGLPWQVFVGFFLLALILIALAAYKGLDRYRQGRRRPALSDPIASCAVETLELVRHEIRLWGKEVLWWYLLPLALGVAVTDLNVSWVAGGMARVFSLSTLAWLGSEAVGTWAGYWFCRWYVRKYYEPQRRELEALLQSLQSN